MLLDSRTMPSLLNIVCLFFIIILSFTTAKVVLEDNDLTGIYVPVFAPMDKDGNLNVTAVKPYANYLKNNGVKGILVHALVGEFPHLTLEEKKQILNAWVKEGRRCGFSVIVQTSGQSFPNTLKLTRYAEKKKVDAIVTLVDRYYPPKTVSELVYYNKLIADQAPNTPFIFFALSDDQYNLPKFFTEATCKIPNFVALGCNSIDTGLKIIAKDLLKDNQKIFVFSNLDFASVFEMGLNATASIPGNLFPGLTMDILNAVKQGDFEQAREKQMLLNRRSLDCIFDGSFISGSSISSLKASIKMISGIDIGPVRPPLPVTDEEKRKIIAQRLRDDNVELKG